VASDLTVVACSDTNQHLTATPQWLQFSDGDWLEVGIITGRANGVCESGEIIYTYRSTDGVQDWTTHGAVTLGSTYTFSITDQAQDQNWRIWRLPGTTYRYVTVAGHSTGFGIVGGEVTDNASTVARTHMTEIRYYSAGQTFLWTSSVSLPGNHAPMNRLVCTNYHHIHFGTATLTPC
jgi:hypothetical protein